MGPARIRCRPAWHACGSEGGQAQRPPCPRSRGEVLWRDIAQVQGARLPAPASGFLERSAGRCPPPPAHASLNNWPPFPGITPGEHRTKAASCAGDVGEGSRCSAFIYGHTKADQRNEQQGADPGTRAELSAALSPSQGGPSGPRVTFCLSAVPVNAPDGEGRECDRHTDWGDLTLESRGRVRGCCEAAVRPPMAPHGPPRTHGAGWMGPAVCWTLLLWGAEPCYPERSRGGCVRSRW